MSRSDAQLSPCVRLDHHDSLPFQSKEKIHDDVCGWLLCLLGIIVRGDDLCNHVTNGEVQYRLLVSVDNVHCYVLWWLRQHYLCLYETEQTRYQCKRQDINFKATCYEYYRFYYNESQHYGNYCVYCLRNNNA